MGAEPPSAGTERTTPMSAYKYINPDFLKSVRDLKLIEVAPAAPCSLPCPKCGSADIYRRHRAAKEEWSRDEKRRDYETDFVSYVGWSAKAKSECITHHCRCCQWKWDTAPLAKNT